MRYADELTKAMTILGEKRDTIFLGQAVCVPGTAMTQTFRNVPKEKLLEMPVVEEMQMGISLGMSVAGLVPITVYPRWNFLLLAVNQLVNHVDRLREYSRDEYVPKLIIRTSVGAEKPVHPQHQHVGNFSDAFRLMLRNTEIVELVEPGMIVPEYRHAYERVDGKNTILVEFGDFYNEK